MQEISEMTKVVEGYRLSPEQEHLWRLMQNGDHATYRAQGAILIDGLLDREILAGAIRQVVGRHESLRTGFHRPAGVKSPLQIVSPDAEPAWRFMETSETDLEKLFETERARSTDSPLQLLLVKVSPRSHLLIITLPALSADNATLENFTRELSQCYGSDGPELEEVAQYPQFSEWQNQLLEGDDAQTGRDYWLSQDWPALKNPLEQDAEQQHEFQTSIHQFTIDAQPIHAVAAELRVSTGIFLLTCWHTFLWRLTEQPETVVGVLHEGRSFADLEGLFGLCDKWLPVSCKFHQHVRFNDQLSQVQRRVNEAAEWPEYFVWEDQPNGAEPFIPFCFEMQDGPTSYESAGLKFLLARKAVCFDRFKLKLTCVADGEMQLEYDAQLYRAEVIAHIANCFETLVASAA